MDNFRWHLMSDEEPEEEGPNNYILRDFRGGLRLAYGFKRRDPPIGSRFWDFENGYRSIRIEGIKAWAEIPPLEVGNE